MMYVHHALMGAESTTGPPVIRTIGVMDLKDALARGMSDFSAMPTHVFFLCLIYPIVGLILARVSFGYDVLSLLFPLAAGFALLGPFVAIGFYELSRQREQGLEPSWQDAFDVLHSPSRDAIAALGLDRKSTRLNSSHEWISYAVFCLKKKNNRPRRRRSGRKLKHNKN